MGNEKVLHTLFCKGNYVFPMIIQRWHLLFELAISVKVLVNTENEEYFFYIRFKIIMKLIPINNTGKLKLYSVSTDTELELPLMEGGVSAGFPSPAEDFLDNKIDLNKHLIKNEASTFIAVTDGYSMKGAGIGNKDLLIIDKSLEPTDGKIAVCVIDGEFVLKRLKVNRDGIWLMPENEDFKPKKVTEFNDFEIWGIVTFSIQKH